MLKSSLYERDLYLNKNVLNIFNSDIIEYDMESAGYSLIQEYHLLPDATIKRLATLGKHDRDVTIGKIQRKDKEFSKELLKSFKKARELFFDLNDLEDQDILSIKKDAILALKPCDHERISPHINFRQKHHYTSYLYTGLVEVYYNPTDFRLNGTIDVKGISDEKLALHKDYILKFFGAVFHRMETGDKRGLLKYIRRFFDRYKSYDLEVGYYRSFDPDSIFIDKEEETIYEDYWEESKESLDIRYNYFYVLIPVAKTVLR